MIRMDKDPSTFRDMNPDFEKQKQEMKDKEQELKKQIEEIPDNATGHIYSSMKATLFEKYPKGIVKEFLEALQREGIQSQKAKEKEFIEKVINILLEDGYCKDDIVLKKIQKAKEVLEK